MPALRTPAWRPLVALVLCASFGIACDSIYYKTMKRFGMEKRDILVDRVRDAQKAQTEAKEEFQTATAERRLAPNDGGAVGVGARSDTPCWIRR